MIRGKFWLSANYPAERHAFPQDNPRKVLTFHGFYHGKACLDTEKFAITCLSADYTAERHAFARNNPQRVLIFREIIPRKGMPFRGIIHRQLWLSADYPREVKLRARISPQIREKTTNNFLTFIRGLLGVDSRKKRDQKISCYSPFKLQRSSRLMQIFQRSVGGQLMHPTELWKFSKLSPGTCMKCSDVFGALRLAAISERLCISTVTFLNRNGSGTNKRDILTKCILR